MAYLFAAFLILWAVTFGYIFSIGARQKRLQQELEALQEKEQDSA
jgi:CcmD family protein